MAEERTLGQLVTDAGRDVSELVKYEVALAKAELQADVRRGALAGGLFGAAAFLGLLSLVTLVIAAGLGLAEVLPGWLAFLVVAILQLVVAGIFGLVGRSLIGRIRPPERAIASAKETLAALRGQTPAR